MVLQYDLHIVELFKPQIVVLELGTNDLSHLAPTTVCSSLDDLTGVLHLHYAVQRVVLCQTLFRDKNQDFNENVTLLNKYSSVVISSVPYTYFWKHRSLWNFSKTLYLKDSVHLNAFGQVKLYRSTRGAVLHSLNLL